MKKIDIINSAYSQLRISGLTVQPTPEDLEVALDRLEDFAYEIRDSVDSGYQYSANPDVNDNALINPKYRNMFKTNLAVRLATDFNKVIPPTLQAQAVQSLSSAETDTAANRLSEVAYPDRMAIGSGNELRGYRYQRYYRQTANTPASSETVVIYVGDINDYQINVGSDLLVGETIQSYTLEADSGLDAVSSSATDTVIEYRIKAINANSSWKQVKAVVTTSQGRVLTFLVDFEVLANTTVGGNGESSIPEPASIINTSHDYSMLGTEDYIICQDAVSIGLVSVAAATKPVTIIAQNGTVVINANSGDTVDGLASVNLTNGNAYKLIPNEATNNWAFG